MAATNVNETLNFTSPNFDPLAALYSDGVTVPRPGVAELNNLLEYERYMCTGELPRTRGKKKKAATTSKSTAARVESLQKILKEVPVGDVEEDGAIPGMVRSHGRRGASYRNVFTRMEGMQGPMGQLYECVQDRIPIRVCTRTFKGLRGICRGYLVAYDKYWNLAMVDVDEVYKKPTMGKSLFNEERLTFTKINKNTAKEKTEQTKPESQRNTSSSSHQQTSSEHQQTSSDHQQTSTRRTNDSYNTVSGAASGDKQDRDETESKTTNTVMHRKVIAEKKSGNGEETKDLSNLEEELAKLQQQLSLLSGDEDEDCVNEDDNENNFDNGDDCDSGDDNYDNVDDDCDNGDGNYDNVDDDCDNGDEDNDGDKEDGSSDNGDSEDGKEDICSSSDNPEIQEQESMAKETKRNASSVTLDINVCDSKNLATIDNDERTSNIEKSVDSKRKECVHDSSKTNRGMSLETSENTGSGHQCSDNGRTETGITTDSMSTSNEICHEKSKKKVFQLHVGQQHGKRIIESEHFIKRHVNQLFIRGDNIVLIMVCRDIE
ncbi:uncharacterized protein LOC144435426 [Glandiceps talaboti]